MKKNEPYRNLLIGLLLLSAVMGVYFQASHYEFVRFDDDMYVFENRNVCAGLTRASIVWAFTSEHGGNWHPLTGLSHMLDCELFGLNASRHHVVNILFHAANVLLLFYVLKRMTGAVWPSALVAMLFGIHPLHVESVAWISERKDVLSTLFWMLTLLAYIRFVERRTIGRYALMTLFFVLGLMAKPMLVTLPFVLLLLDYWPLARFEQKGVSIKRCIIEKSPLFILSIVSCIVTYLVQQRSGAMLEYEHLPWYIRTTNALISYVIYLLQTVWPLKLGVYYPHPGLIIVWWKTIVSGLALAGITWAVYRGRKKFPYLLSGWCWYLGTLVPVIGFIQVGGQAHADRYTYIPLIGIFIAAAWGIDSCIQWRPALRRILVPVVIITVGGWTVLSWNQLSYWRDSVSLFEQTLRVTKNNAVIHNNLGAVLRFQGQSDEALEHFEAALAINPNYLKAHNNMAVLLIDRGDYDAAIKHAGFVLHNVPTNVEAANRLAVALYKKGAVDKAIIFFEKAFQINPDNPDLLNNYGTLLYESKRYEEAERMFRRLIQLRPDSKKVYGDLGEVLYSGGKYEQSIEMYNHVIQWNPEDVKILIRLAQAYRQLGHLDESERCFDRALQLNVPIAQQISAHVSLGMISAQRGDYKQARVHFLEIIRLDPENVMAYNNLGNAYESDGLYAEAIDCFTRALALKPDYQNAKINLERVQNRKRELDGNAASNNTG